MSSPSPGYELGLGYTVVSNMIESYTALECRIHRRRIWNRGRISWYSVHGSRVVALRRADLRHQGRIVQYVLQL